MKTAIIALLLVTIFSSCNRGSGSGTSMCMVEPYNTVETNYGIDSSGIASIDHRMEVRIRNGMKSDVKIGQSLILYSMVAGTAMPKPNDWIVTTKLSMPKDSVVETEHHRMKFTKRYIRVRLVSL